MLKEYAITLLKTLTFVGIALNFLHPKQAKMMRLAVGVALIAAIMLPLVDIFGQYDSVFDKNTSLDFDIDTKVNDDMIEAFFENAIEEYISGAYGISKDGVTVNADGFDLSSMRAQRLYVTLSEKIATVDYRRLEEELAKEFTNGGNCRVELDIG